MGNLPDPVTISDLGFVVEWQLADWDSPLVDLSGADQEVVLPDDAEVESPPAR